MVVSSFGLGGGSFGGFFGDVTDAKAIVEYALRNGVNYIDTAPWYGQGRSEKIIGEALKGVPREAYYIATKVGRYEFELGKMFNFTREHILKGFEESLNLLGVEYVDLLQVHDFEFSASLEQIVNHTLPALAELKKAGKIRYIGINSYQLSLLRRVVELAPPGAVDTVLAYCRFSLYNKDYEHYVDFFEARGVGTINASPIGMGLLSPGGPPQWHAAPTAVKEACAKAVKYAESKGFSAAELAIKFCCNSRFPVTLNSVTNLNLLERNLERCVLDGELTKAEDEILEEMEDKFFKFVTISQWENLDVEKYWAKMEAAGLEQPVDNRIKYYQVSWLFTRSMVEQ